MSEKPVTFHCACVAEDPHDCWRSRYGLSFCESVEADGGPCMCLCHDDFIEDNAP